MGDHNQPASRTSAPHRITSEDAHKRVATDGGHPLRTYCPECGAENQSGSVIKTCRKCGADLVATDGGLDATCEVDACPNAATRPTTLDAERAHVCDEHSLDYKRVERVPADNFRANAVDYTVDASADGGIEVEEVERCRAVVATTGCRCQNSAREVSDLCGVHENAEAVMTIDDRGEGTATDGGLNLGGISLKGTTLTMPEVRDLPRADQQLALALDRARSGYENSARFFLRNAIDAAAEGSA